MSAVENAFGYYGVDYSMLVKIYAPTSQSGRYSPGECIGAEKHAVLGHADERHVCTSHVERSNLTMRMNMRRMTRLTNAFSKKIENLGHAVALHFMYYNFARIHQTTRVTPAMAAGVDYHLWSLEEIAEIAGG